MDPNLVRRIARRFARDATTEVQLLGQNLFQWIQLRCNGIRAQLDSCRFSFDQFLAQPLVTATGFASCNFNRLANADLTDPNLQPSILFLNGVYSIIRPRDMPNNQRVYHIIYAQQMGDGQIQLQEDDPRRVVTIRQINDDQLGFFLVEIIDDDPADFQVQYHPLMNIGGQQATVPEDGKVFFLDQHRRQRNNELLENQEMMNWLRNTRLILQSVADDIGTLRKACRNFNQDDENDAAFKHNCLALIYQQVIKCMTEFQDTTDLWNLIESYVRHNAMEMAINVEIAAQHGQEAFRLMG